MMGGHSMSEMNSTRNGCRDVFHAFLVKNATYDSNLEIPCLAREVQKPLKLIAFSKAIGCKEFDAWIHFYEDDVAFERIWNTPNKYLPIIKKFKGVITPDFSVYRDMPLVMQQWNIYRSRAIGHWLQENGVSVIPNIRFGDERTHELSCASIQKYGTIAVGSHGCIKLLSDRNYFVSGLEYVVDRLEPNILVVYGAAPVKIFAPYKEKSIEVLQFDSDFMKSRKAVGA